MGNFYFLKRKNVGNIIVLLTTITPSKKKNSQTWIPSELFLPNIIHNFFVGIKLIRNTTCKQFSDKLGIKLGIKLIPNTTCKQFSDKL